MDNAESMISLFLDSGGFRELDTPVIVTSGEFITPFFCNAEKVCGDINIESFLAAHGDDPQAVIDHAVSLSRSHPAFKNVIDAMAVKAGELLGEPGPERKPAVSGGQRRDWIFSGPVANRLHLPHISIFKDRQVILHHPSGEKDTEDPDLSGYKVVHVADLITRGSSIYSKDTPSGGHTGWVPVLRNRGAEINDLITLVSRNQGGEEMLAREGVNVYPFITVDKQFIAGYAENPEPSLLFLKNPAGWTKHYLRENGPDILLEYCLHDVKKLPRLEKFLHHYQEFLGDMKWTGMIRKRMNAVKQGGNHGDV